MVSVGVEVVARGLSVHGPRGPVFENVDLEVPAGGLLTVHGPGGSGRTSLLLALAGRMRFTGAVRVGGHRLPAGGRTVRGLVALAQAGPAYSLEPRLRVRELLAERRWIGHKVTERNLRSAFSIVGIDPSEAAWVEDLPPEEAVLLAVGLALAERPGAIVVDDVDSGCPPEQRAAVWQALAHVRGTGCTVLASTTEPPTTPADQGTAWLSLPQHSDDRLPRHPDREKRRGEQA